MTTVSHPVRIFRLLHLDNLSACVQRKGLHAPNNLPSDGLPYKTIHNIDIQNERRLRRIPVGTGGTIHDYVAFYFGARSPMLLQLHTGQVDGYNEGQVPLVYLVSMVEAVSQAGLPFVFSDGHGIAAYTQWYDDPSRLSDIDWDTVHSNYWNCTIEDPDRQRRKQAEFLVYKFCPWDLICEIGVIDAAVHAQVSGLLAKLGASIPVLIHQDWYY